MNAFLQLWYTDAVAYAALEVAACVALLSLASLANVIRHEGHAGAIAPEAKKKLLVLFVLALGCAAIGTLTSNAIVMWVSVTGLSAISVSGVAVYERNNTKDLVRRFGMRAMIGAVVSGAGVGILSVLAQQHGAGLANLGALSGMIAASAALPVEWVKAGFILAFLGFGIAFGLAPLHITRGELLSKIPSPLAACVAPLSVLVGVVSLLRLRFVVDSVLNDGSAWTGNVLLVFGTLTVVIAAAALWRTHNYKVWFADVGMLHTGLVLVFAGVGLAGTIPALMHLAGTVVTLTVLFCSAAILHATFKTTKVPGVRQIFRLLPLTGTLLMVGIAGAALFPVSSLFMSGIIGIGYGLQMHFGVTVITLAAMTFALTAAVRFAHTFVVQEQDDLVALQPVRWRLTSVSIVLGCVTLMTLGWWIGTQAGVKFFVTATQAVAQL